MSRASVEEFYVSGDSPSRRRTQAGKLINPLPFNGPVYDTVSRDLRLSLVFTSEVNSEWSGVFWCVRTDTLAASILRQQMAKLTHK